MALKSCPKSKKSPDLVALIESNNRTSTDTKRRSSIVLFDRKKYFWHFSIFHKKSFFTIKNVLPPSDAHEKNTKNDFLFVNKFSKFFKNLENFRPEFCVFCVLNICKGFSSFEHHH